MIDENFYNQSPVSYLAFWFKIKSKSKEKVKNTPLFQRFYLGSKYPNTYFTRQESRCIAYFLLGLNQKQTSKKMGIAITTVSQNCVSMKKKLGCGSKSELIEAVKNTNLKNLLRSIVE